MGVIHAITPHLNKHCCNEAVTGAMLMGVHTICKQAPLETLLYTGAAAKPLCFWQHESGPGAGRGWVLLAGCSKHHQVVS